MGLLCPETLPSVSPGQTLFGHAQASHAVRLPASHH